MLSLTNTTKTTIKKTQSTTANCSDKRWCTGMVPFMSGLKYDEITRLYEMANMMPTSFM